jgi:hypothetical protein
MTHKRNTDGLRKSSEERAKDMFNRCENAINYARDNDEPCSFSNIASIAKVSKAWLYRQPKLKTKIIEIRNQQEKQGVNQAIKRKNYDAITKQLKERNKVLTVKNSELRKQVEVMYGELHKYKKLQEWQS